jgi:Family of unknown function (DUF6095)
MHTNKEILTKGLQYLAWALPLFFIGPSLIYNAFQNKENSWHYVVLFVGIVACTLSILLTFKGLKTILNSIFNK